MSTRLPLSGLPCSPESTLWVCQHPSPPHAPSPSSAGTGVTGFSLGLGPSSVAFLKCKCPGTGLSLSIKTSLKSTQIRLEAAEGEERDALGAGSRQMQTLTLRMDEQQGPLWGTGSHGHFLGQTASENPLRTNMSYMCVYKNTYMKYTNTCVKLTHCAESLCDSAAETGTAL